MHLSVCTGITLYAYLKFFHSVVLDFYKCWYSPMWWNIFWKIKHENTDEGNPPKGNLIKTQIIPVCNISLLPSLAHFQRQEMGLEAHPESWSYLVSPLECTVYFWRSERTYSINFLFNYCNEWIFFVNWLHCYLLGALQGPYWRS